MKLATFRCIIRWAIVSAYFTIYAYEALADNFDHIERLRFLFGEAEALAERIFTNSHPIYAMLFDLQALDVVRIIEARD